jgi:predicted transcriptional regulator
LLLRLHAINSQEIKGAKFLSKQPVDRSQNISLSKSKVKFDFATVRTRVLPILKGIEVKDYPAKIARIRGWSKQNVDYYVKKMVKAGLISRKKRSNFVEYELTAKGQNFLISCEGVLFSSGVFRLHRCFFKYPIVREGLYPQGSFRPVEMVNWTALLGLEQGVTVRKTTMSWIVHVETIYGRSPGELVTSAKNLADRVAQGLKNKYGVVLGDGQINKRHELGIDDPVANMLNRYFEVSTPKRVIDDSPGEDEGELDHLGRDAAVEYLLMPERVKKLEGQMESAICSLQTISDNITKAPKAAESAEVRGIEAQVVALRVDFGKLTAALSQLLNIGSNQSAASEVSKGSGGREYVR